MNEIKSKYASISKNTIYLYDNKGEAAHWGRWGSNYENCTLNIESGILTFQGDEIITDFWEERTLVRNSKAEIQSPKYGYYIPLIDWILRRKRHYIPMGWNALKERKPKTIILNTFQIVLT